MRLPDEPLIFSFFEMRDLLLRRPLLELFLLCGIDIDTPDRFGRTALHIACDDGLDGSWVQLLIEHGAAVNNRDLHDNTPLHEPGLIVDAARVLLSHGADANALNFCFQTPLHCHVFDPALTRLLIKGGPDFYIKDHRGFTPDEFATKKRKALLEGWRNASWFPESDYFEV